MIKINLNTYILIAVFTLGISFTYSQDKKEPAPRIIEVGNTTQKDSIPKIELPEFIITGKEKIDLPYEQKIDILEERLFILPNNSPVIIPSRDFSTVEIETPQKLITQFGRDRNLYNNYIKLGFGRFSTPFAETGLFYNIDRSFIGFNGSYIQSRGHVPNSEFKNGHGKIIFGSILPESEDLFNKSNLNIELSYKGENFKFYGRPILPNNKLERTTDKFNLVVSINSSNNWFLDYNFYILFNNYQSKDKYLIISYYDDAVTEKNVMLRENIMETGIDLIKKIDAWKFFLSTNFTYTNGNNPAQDNLMRKYSKSEIGIGKRFFSKVDIDLSLRFYMYRDIHLDLLRFYDLSLYPISIKDEYKLFPKLDIYYYLNDRITLFARYEPGAVKNTISGAFEKFKYLDENSYVRYSINNQDFSAGAEIFINNNSKLNLAVRYFEQENTPLYRHFYVGPAATCYSCESGIPWYIHYPINNKISKNFQPSADYYYKISDQTELQLGMIYNHFRIEDKKIPYSPDFVLYSSLTHNFPFGLTVKPEIDLSSSRIYSDYYVTKEENLDPFILFNINAEYEIFKNLKVFSIFSNIFDQNYELYKGYAEVPFSFLFGLNYKF